MNESESLSEQENLQSDDKLDDETLNKTVGGNAIIKQMTKDLQPPA